MIIVKKTYVRPNEDAKWFITAHIRYRADKVAQEMAAGNLITEDLTAVDRLTGLHLSIWKDRAAYDAYASDPVMKSIQFLMDKHNQAAGITETVEYIDAETDQS